MERDFAIALAQRCFVVGAERRDRARARRRLDHNRKADLSRERHALRRAISTSACFAHGRPARAQRVLHFGLVAEAARNVGPHSARCPASRALRRAEPGAARRHRKAGRSDRVASTALPLPTRAGPASRMSSTRQCAAPLRQRVAGDIFSAGSCVITPSRTSGRLATASIMRDAFSERIGAANTTFGIGPLVAELVDEVRQHLPPPRPVVVYVVAPDDRASAVFPFWCRISEKLRDACGASYAPWPVAITMRL